MPKFILSGAPEFSADIKRLEIASPAAFFFSTTSAGLLRDPLRAPPVSTPAWAASPLNSIISVSLKVEATLPRKEDVKALLDELRGQAA